MLKIDSYLIKKARYLLSIWPVVLLPILFSFVIYYINDSRIPSHMVCIPGGEYKIGGEDHPIINILRQKKGLNPSLAKALCTPQSEGEIEKTFYVDVYEVTNREYQQFLNYIHLTQDHQSFCSPFEEENKDHTPKFFSDVKFNDDDQPVVGIDWFDAYAFARFSGKRLPTDDEWERACRSNDGRLYPWGNTFSPERANISNPDILFPIPGEKFKTDSSIEGVINLAGNVHEWTMGKDKGGKRLVSLRGGGCYNDPGEIFALSYLQLSTSPTTRSSDIGFRCVSDQPRPKPSEEISEEDFESLLITAILKDIILDDSEEYKKECYNYFYNSVLRHESPQVKIKPGKFIKGGLSDSFVLELAREISPRLLERLCCEPPLNCKIKTFYIDAMEVTNCEYKKFLNDKLASLHWYCHPQEPGGKNHTPLYLNDDRFNHPDQPVVGIDWWDAYAYARWAGKHLPTADEWECAARGKEGRLYPWGNKYNRGSCNTLEKKHAYPVPVGEFPDGSTPNGIFNLGGNVCEWTSNFDDINVIPTALLMGGHFRERGDIGALSFRRIKADREVRHETIGFRCACRE